MREAVPVYDREYDALRFFLICFHTTLHHTINWLHIRWIVCKEIFECASHARKERSE